MGDSGISDESGDFTDCSQYDRSGDFCAPGDSLDSGESGDSAESGDLVTQILIQNKWNVKSKPVY